MAGVLLALMRGIMGDSLMGGAFPGGAPDVDNRLLESSDNRLTEAGDLRLLESA